MDPRVDQPTTPFQHGGTDAPPPVPAARADGRVPDRGSKKAALVALLILIPVLATVVVLQQFAVRVASSASGDAERVEVIPPSTGDQLTLMSKLTVAVDQMLDEFGQGQPESARAGVLRDYVKMVDDAALSPSETIRAAVIAGDVLGPEEASARLDAASDLIERSLAEPDGMSDELAAKLRGDIETLRRVYDRRAIEPAAASDLVAHHGWFGELALVFNGPNSARDPLVGSGLLLVVLLIGGGLGALLLGLAGFVLFVVAVVLAATGRLRPGFVPPAPGGSVHLETFTAFVLGFLMLQAFGVLMEFALPAETAAIVSLAAQWLLVPIAAWPVLRGVPWRTWREQVGLIAPRGVLREVGAGIVGYIAGLPVLLLGAGVTLLLVLLREVLTGGVSGSGGGAAPVPRGPSGPSNPVFDMVQNQGAVGLVLLGSLLVVWAPVVEELILRGALYRHLRGRLHWVVSAIVSAMLFGLLHQYDLLMLGPVIALGVIFAAVREWRGSLIGAIIGHALHNGTVFVVILTLLWVMG